MCSSYAQSLTTDISHIQLISVTFNWSQLIERHHCHPTVHSVTWTFCTCWNVDNFWLPRFLAACCHNQVFISPLPSTPLLLSAGMLVFIAGLNYMCVSLLLCDSRQQHRRASLAVTLDFKFRIWYWFIVSHSCQWYIHGRGHKGLLSVPFSYFISF